MAEIFADTGYWIALINRSSPAVQTVVEMVDFSNMTAVSLF
ncbi:MAG: hypothetical protein OXR67_07910 [Chloroflexota bacterium]|nr:hypothetical protein [Chloroflexota bacterium]